MSGVISRITKTIVSTFTHQEIVNTIEKLEKERHEYDIRITNLTRATLDGDESWMKKVVKEDPNCALRIIEECGKSDS
jgi:hypothetical protein